MTLVAPLPAFGRADLAEAGGKAANLGELARNGFPVPDGFVVTTAAYERAVAEHGDPGHLARAPLRDELRAAVAAAYAALGGGPVAVRSSATAEDLPGAAFAGQQDTYLNVVGEEALADAVRRCWASLGNERAVAYRRRLGIADADVRIAVVVQRMVEAETAGVMFTADPVSGDRSRIVVDASTGLGEAVVSGLVTPDHYVLDTGGDTVSHTPGRREVVIRSAPGGGVIRESGRVATGATPPAADSALPDGGASADGRAPADGGALPGAVLRELARLGAEVAAHFGRPQDIEWACAGGRVWLLQARPMTALPPPPVGRLGPVRRRLGSVLTEYVPVRPYPIDASTWLPYGPAGLMAQVVATFGIHGAFEGFLREEDGVVYGLVPPRPRPSAGLLAAPFRIAARARRYDPARWTGDARFRRVMAGTRELAGRDLAAMPWPELVRMPRRVLDVVRPVAGLRSDYLPGAGVALLRLRVSLALLGAVPLFGELISGARTRTGDANRALEELAEEARRTGALDADPLPASFAARLEAFLAEYGHRETASPLLVTPPTWADAPETVLGMIRMLAAGPPAGAQTGTAGALDRLLARPRLRRSPARRARMLRRVEAARAGVAFREDSHFFFTMPLPVLRRSLLELGRRLRDAGVLDEPEDVFHLRLEELEAVGDLATAGREHLDRLRATALARAAKREELAGVRLIDPAAVFPPRPAEGALVSGTPASGGRATGPVKVIRDPARFGDLAPGDVLVCPYTNPSWTPLFQRAAAVVVDTGGSASHAAIVAREYGIPAVMGTGGGTSVLADGLLVAVDGDTGHVFAASGDDHRTRAAAAGQAGPKAP
ncbi:PEP/pyruvate-binding domain-containing protein [Nonomuraea muscovyensis]|uniref:Pyruvate,water dikinase n=1 Tax=Nonomuraea muscovyensis TaxID=1124761 RepID=A0A7X0BX06_9ACTN|nr:PEP/pyruvate-binding domain-containing protein [Nonomuraea muscovyensis]MBB6344499.1 pyruvate,water dikinase [Nonomuraea muscovyensis]